MKLSIVTINYNNAIGLKKTLDSVAKQTCSDFEHIIVDGESTDESVEIIQSYSQSPLALSLKWTSEPDTGIYNAMNKGIKMASGEYLLFLNSGDYIVDANVIEEFIKCKNSTDIIAGNILLGEQKRLLKCPPKTEELTFELFVEDSLMHAATFIKRSLFEQYGLYNENHRIVSDWEFFVKVLINNNCSYSTLDCNISVFDTTGISNQEAHVTMHEQERQEVISVLMPRLMPVYEELMDKRRVCEEYKFLKEGRLGWIVQMCLKLKSLKRK